MNEHLLQVYEIECKDKGNAFLTDQGLLITVKHVVAANRMELSQQYKIWLSPGDGGEKIECKILEHDEDDFSNSTLILLEPQLKSQKELPCCFQRVKKTIATAQIREIVGYLGSTFKESTIKDTKEVISTDAETNEKRNNQIILESMPSSCSSWSGSPVVCGDTIYGILVAETKDSEKKTIDLQCLCDQDFWQQVGKLRNRLQEKQEAQQKASQGIPTFAEYIAKACDDCPNGLRLLADPTEYKNKYPKQDIEAHRSKLKEYLFQMCKAGKCGADSLVKKIKDSALAKLSDLYPDDKDSKKMQDVYISALFHVFELAYRSRATSRKDLKRVKCLLDIASEDFKDAAYFHAYRHLLLAEYYVASNMYAEARKELGEVRTLCAPNTNCYAYSYILDVCCLSAKDSKKDHDEAVKTLAAALKDRRECCRFYLTHTEVERTLAYYWANRANTKYDDLNLEWFKSALGYVEDAYRDDSGEGGMETSRTKDRECFRYICRVALDSYSKKGFKSYGDWYTFYKEVAKGQIYRVEHETLEREIKDKWIGVLDQWNCGNRTTKLESTNAMEYVYSEELLLKEELQELLEKCAEKALFLKVTDFRGENPEVVTDSLKDYNLMLSKILGATGTGYQLVGEAFLYIYEYTPTEGKTLPVWHLICVK